MIACALDVLFRRSPLEWLIDCIREIAPQRLKHLIYRDWRRQGLEGRSSGRFECRRGLGYRRLSRLGRHARRNRRVRHRRRRRNGGHGGNGGNGGNARPQAGRRPGRSRRRTPVRARAANCSVHRQRPGRPRSRRTASSSLPGAATGCDKRRRRRRAPADGRRPDKTGPAKGLGPGRSGSSRERYHRSRLWLSKVRCLNRIAPCAASNPHIILNISRMDSSYAGPAVTRSLPTRWMSLTAPGAAPSAASVLMLAEQPTTSPINRQGRWIAYAPMPRQMLSHRRLRCRRRKSAAAENHPAWERFRRLWAEDSRFYPTRKRHRNRKYP